jgi:HEPN domain-containing protein
MQPRTSRDFLRIALQRLTTAEALLSLRLNLDAQYIGGYTVECSLKALILERTPVADQAATLKKISSRAPMHRPEVLLGELRRLGVSLTKELARRLRRFVDWAPDLRYETGRRDTGETIAFLKTAKAIYEWAEAQVP